MFNWIRKLRGLPQKPCHVAHGAVPSDRKHLQRQGVAVCKKCGALHLTKPQLTDHALQQVIGGS